LTTIALPAWLMLVYWMVIQFFGGLQSIGAASGCVLGSYRRLCRRYGLDQVVLAS
jgi:hypothetical protein